jgi:hypothetical protein
MSTLAFTICGAADAFPSRIPWARRIRAMGAVIFIAASAENLCASKADRRQRNWEVTRIEVKK